MTKNLFRIIVGGYGEYKAVVGMDPRLQELCDRADILNVPSLLTDREVMSLRDLPAVSSAWGVLR